MDTSTAVDSYTRHVAEESEEVVVGLDRHDLEVLRARGVDVGALVRSHVHERAVQIRAEERKRSAYRRRLIREVAAERRASGVDYSADEIVADIHADRRAARWE